VSSSSGCPCIEIESEREREIESESEIEREREIESEIEREIERESERWHLRLDRRRVDGTPQAHVDERGYLQGNERRANSVHKKCNSPAAEESCMSEHIAGERNLRGRRQGK